MATFSFDYVVLYNGNGDNAELLFDTTYSNVLSDGESDTTFEAGDTVAGGIGVNETYLGTTIIDGQSWPVSYEPIWGETYVYMTQAPVSPPSSLQVTEDATFCFAAGTLIATPAGEVAVERLAIGDLVTTSDGRAVPVTFLGRQTLAPRFSRLHLIRVSAGALGRGLPLRDLTLTGDHALMIDGLLVTAGALVNGTTVTEVPVADLTERVTVYHVETEAHDVILAEGTPSETFIDYAGRRHFDNYAEHVALYGDAGAMVENPAPRVTAARHLPAALRARLGIMRAA